jgi:hypothetical protein
MKEYRARIVLALFLTGLLAWAGMTVPSHAATGDVRVVFSKAGLRHSKLFYAVKRGNWP